MLPNIVVQGKEYPQKKLTTLERLKIKLGQDAFLLDYIPLSRVDMVNGEQMSYLFPNRIRVGFGNVAGKLCKIWAFISENVTRDGSLDMKIYGEDEEGSWHRYTCEEAYRAEQLLDMYDLGAKYGTAALIKCCFILKGVPLPSGLKFSAHFLRHVKSVCRQYQDGKKASSDTTEGLAEKAELPRSMYKGAMIARKSQPHAPFGQLSKLPSTLSSQAANTSSSREVMAPQNESQVLASTNLSEIPCLSQRKNPSAGTTTPTMPAAMRSDNKSARTSSAVSQIQSHPTSTEVTARPATPNVSATKVAPAAQRRDPVAIHPERQAFINGHLGKSIAGAPTGPRVSHSAVITPPPEENMRMNPTQEGGVGQYQASKGQIKDLEDELDRVDVATRTNKKKYDKLRDDKKHRIDVEMKERHKAERKELDSKHMAEETAQKGEYAALVGEYNSYKEAFSKQREAVLRQKEDAKQELKGRRESLSLEELLTYVDKADDEARARKRGKTGHLRAGDDKE